MGQPGMTVRSMRLGMELRRIREQAEVTQEAAANVIDASSTKISRLEKGLTGVSRLELNALLDLYGVQDGTYREGLLELSRDSRKRGWWQQQGDAMPPKLQQLIELEATASEIVEYESVLIPGLFQTEAYAHATISGFPDPYSTSVAHAVEIRMKRQELLTRPDAPRIICVLDEATLRREVGGPTVMAEQLGKLVKISESASLTIQVIPYAHGAHAGTDGSFRIFSYPAPANLDIVFLEQKVSRVFIEDEPGLDAYRRAAELLRNQALPGRESIEMISAIKAEYEGR